MIVIFPVLVLLIGLVFWGLFDKSPKVQQLGWFMVQVGVALTTWAYLYWRIPLFR